MLLFWKKIEKIEEILKILLTVLIVFKKNLEVWENFNKMYTTMHAFHLFFKEKHCILIVYVHYRIFPKNWVGGPNAVHPVLLGGGVAWLLCPPPRSGPHATDFKNKLCNYIALLMIFFSFCSIENSFYRYEGTVDFL